MAAQQLQVGEVVRPADRTRDDVIHLQAFPERPTSREQMHTFIVDQMMAATDDEAMAAVRCYIIRNRLGCGTLAT